VWRERARARRRHSAQKICCRISGVASGGTLPTQRLLLGGHIVVLRREIGARSLLVLGIAGVAAPADANVSALDDGALKLLVDDASVVD
jgi:hypothetical protein